MSSRASQVWHFSLTYHAKLEDRELLHDALTSLCDKFVYQLEEAPTTKSTHFQCYLHLKQKDRESSVLKKLAAEGLEQKMFVKRSSNAGKRALKKYCMKKDTRIAGPWADKKIYLGHDLIKKLRPWQLELEAKLVNDGNIDPRVIYWFYDKQGGAGKTSFAKYMMFHHDIITLTFADAKDLLYVVSKFQNRSAYIFDLSRTKGGKSSMSEIYQALEAVKNGYFISQKYESDIVMMQIPHVVVFSNHMPDVDCLSKDRWRIRCLNTDGMGDEVDAFTDAFTLMKKAQHLQQMAKKRMEEDSMQMEMECDDNKSAGGFKSWVNKH